MRIARHTLVAVFIGAVCAVVPGVAQAAPGDLTFRGCITDAATAGCASPSQPALAGADGVAVSPDGRSVYVASEDDDSVSVFNRAADGSLSFAGCVADTNAAGCTVPPTAVLDGAEGVAVSPDGRSVYVASSRDYSVTTFDRTADGALHFNSCETDTGVVGCSINSALEGAVDVAVSPDGGSVYVVTVFDDSLLQFTRAADGSLSNATCLRDSPQSGCTVPSPGPLSAAYDLAMSADGSALYVAAYGDHAISRFSVGPGGVPAFTGCIADDAGSGCPVATPGLLRGTSGVATSPDGASVYGTGPDDDAVSHFSAEPGGGLALRGCLATAVAGCATSAAIEGATAATVSPDGASVYVGTIRSEALVNLRRATDGSVTQQSCFASTTGEGCSAISPAVMGRVDDVVVSPDNRSLYAVGADVLLAFDREPLPDTTAPETIKGKGPKKKIKTKRKRVKVKFRFSSPEPGVTFSCALDKKAAKPCTSPAKAKVKAKRKAKKHRFTVAAVDAAGNADQTPVVFKFKVQRKRR